MPNRLAGTNFILLVLNIFKRRKIPYDIDNNNSNKMPILADFWQNVIPILELIYGKKMFASSGPSLICFCTISKRTAEKNSKWDLKKRYFKKTLFIEDFNQTINGLSFEKLQQRTD